MTGRKTRHEGDLDLSELFRVIRKRAILVAGIVAACLGLGIAYAFLTPSTYEAVATVKVPDGSKGGSDLLRDLAALSSSGDQVETYLEVARSRNVASKAVGSMRLGSRQEYAGLSPQRVVTKLASRSQISNVKKSNLISFKVQAAGPDLAAELSNALAASFIAANLEFNRSGAGSRRRFIEEQLVDIKKKLVDGEEALRHFSVKQKTLGGSPNGPGSGGSLRDPVLNLKSRVMDLQIERASLASRYAAGHPKLKNLAAELSEARSQLDAAMAKIPNDEAGFIRLSRDVKVDETIYNMLLEKGQEARLAENVDDSGMVVVDAAEAPERPIKPNRRTAILMSLMLGLALGLALAFGLENFKDTLDRTEQLEQATGLPHLGMISDFRTELKAPMKNQQRFSSDYLSGNPAFDFSFYQESFKILRTNLTYAAVDGDVQAIAILSPSHEEGKTLMNANLAISLAQSGKRTLLVDADFRKPSVHKLFGVTAVDGGGLPMLLVGQTRLIHALVPSRFENLMLLPNHVSPPNAAELLGSAAMKDVVKELKKDFDYIIFDGAPILPITDSVVLSTSLDGVILLARAGLTRRHDLQSAQASLKAVKAKVLGTLLNGVNLKTFGYGYGHGYGRGYGHGTEASEESRTVRSGRNR